MLLSIMVSDVSYSRVFVICFRFFSHIKRFWKSTAVASTQSVGEKKEGLTSNYVLA